MLRHSLPSLTIILALFLLNGAAGAGAGGCTSSWSTQEYKSFGQIRSEILGKFAGARIMSVQLCGEGLNAYIRVTIDTGREVRTVRIGAK